MAGVITASQPSWIDLFTGLSPRCFGTLVTQLRHEGADAVRRGRPWSLPLEYRVLLVTAYWHTNLTLRQLAPLFGVSKSAANRIISHLGPLLALKPRRRFRKSAVLIVDGTLVPLATIRRPSDRRTTGTPPTTRSSSMPTTTRCRGRPAVARQPQRLQGMGTVRRQERRCNTTVVADGGYRGTGLVIPHRRERGQSELPAWKEEHNASHRQVRARVEHAFARMKTCLRDCRFKGDGVHHAMRGIARLHNLALSRQASGR